MLHLRFSSSFILRGVKEGPERGRTLIEMLAVLVIIGIMVIAGLTGLSLAMRKVKVENNIKDMNLVAVDIFSEPVNFARTNIGQGIVFRGMSGSKQTATKTAEDMFSVSMTNLETSVCEDMFEQAHNYEMIHESTFTQPDICVNGQAIFYYQLDNHINDNQGCGYGMVWNETAGMCCRSFTVPDSSECRIYTETSASKGVCPDYTQTNLSGPCGTNGYCNNGECVPCPATSESCSIESDEYDTETQCLLTKKVTCGENEICTNGSCVCSNGYELYNGVCLPICNGSGMTGDRDEEGNCQCIEGTNADTCACPDGYIYLEGKCQRFECRGGPIEYTCYINDERCALGCDAKGENCQIGACYPSKCTGEQNFTIKNYWGSYGGCEYDTTFCTPWGKERTDWYCFDKQMQHPCCDAYSPDFETCYWGSCINPCVSYDNVDSNYGHAEYTFVTDRHKGCLFDNGIRCLLYNQKWTCYINDYFMECGSGCDSPINCGNCSITYCPEGATWNADKQQCCIQDGNSEICCGRDSICYRDGLRCAINCPDMGKSCGVGLCYDPGCPSGLTFGYNGWYYGCMNETILITQALNGQGPYVCFYQGEVGANYCSDLSGQNCNEIILEMCSLKHQCPYGYPVTETCTCDTNPDAKVGDYCCAPGHTYINGGCTLINCPEGQEPDENGICKDTN